MTSRRPFRRSIFIAAALSLMAAFTASPARADRCDDSAKELANNIDKMKVNFKAANTVYLTHPLARELSTISTSPHIPPPGKISLERKWKNRRSLIVTLMPTSRQCVCG